MISSYSLADTTPSLVQCTGYAFSYGASGTYIYKHIPNTDPAVGPANILVTSRTAYVDAPGQGVALAAQHYAEASTPFGIDLLVPVGIASRTPLPAAISSFPNPFSQSTRVTLQTPRGGEFGVSV